MADVEMRLVDDVQLCRVQGGLQTFTDHGNPFGRHDRFPAAGDAVSRRLLLRTTLELVESGRVIVTPSLKR
jgi:hypothetical protein